MCHGVPWGESETLQRPLVVHFPEGNRFDLEGVLRRSLLRHVEVSSYHGLRATVLASSATLAEA